MTLAGAFVVLGTLFVKHQFQYEYVYSHSALDHELQYLIAGVWSGQEGSFLLWGLLSGLCGSIAVRSVIGERKWFIVVYSLFMIGISSILAFESPFNLNDYEGMPMFIPPDGVGMSAPLLNYWMVIHPPVIFIGFSSLTILFAWAVAALMHRDLKSWIDGVRPYSIFAMTFLGLGLAMGGFWAYETLGWGGFWAWDPVENTSFVPWCAVIAFVHGIFVQKSKNKWFLANSIFAALPLVLFMYGTFLTRSGYLGEASVHSFAEMDNNALKILIGLAALVILGYVVALGLNFKPAMAKIEASKEMETQVINRQTVYGIGIWLLLAFSCIAAFGMSFPLFQRILSQPPKAVLESTYHLLMGWFYPAIMIVMAAAPFITWRGLKLGQLFLKVINSIALTTVSYTHLRAHET